jgi:hypothetical protein
MEIESKRVIYMQVRGKCREKWFVGRRKIGAALKGMNKCIGGGGGEDGWMYKPVHLLFTSPEATPILVMCRCELSRRSRPIC